MPQPRLRRHLSGLVAWGGVLVVKLMGGHGGVGRRSGVNDEDAMAQLWKDGWDLAYTTGWPYCNTRTVALCILARNHPCLTGPSDVLQVLQEVDLAQAAARYLQAHA